jgi:cytoskeleton protein RodZ
MRMAEYAQGSDQEQGSPLPPLPDVEVLGVGEALRKRREQLGWSIGDVADWLRIRSAYLEALENGNASVLPAEVYALGFLRTYGQALGFNPDQMLKLYRQEGRLGTRKPDLDFPDPLPDRRLPPAVSISLGLAVILASYVGWYCFVGHAPPVPERVPPVATLMPGESAKNAPSPQVASILPDHNMAQLPPLPVVTQPAPAQSTPVVPTGPDASALANTTSVANAPVPSQAGKPVAAEPASVPPAVEQPAASVPGTASASASASADAPLMLRAQAPSWVQVRNAAGKVVYDHVLQPGDVWTVPADNGPYSLTVGNAGGVIFAQGDKTTPPLGRNGAVLRHIALTPEVVQQVRASGGVSAAGTATVVPLPAGVAVPARTSTVATPAADAAVTPESGAGHVAQSAVEVPKPPSHHAALPPAETSADDLNARQLNGAGAH